MKIEKILVGIDFGPATESIITYASTFARAMNASLNLLHVLDYIVTPPAYLEPYIEEEKNVAVNNFDILKRQLTDAGIKTQTEITVGRLHESFDTALRKIHADMLILGFIAHTFRRSSSEKLVKGLQMPMLVVSGEKAKSVKSIPVEIKRILCPTDFSEFSRKALNVAKELGDIFSSKLEILHVFPDYLIKKMKTPEERERAMQELHSKAKDNLDQFLRDTDKKNAGIIDRGEPDKRIVAISKEKDIDLIVMGARGLGLIKGMLIGSVTDAVMKSSPCPVLIIH